MIKCPDCYSKLSLEGRGIAVCYNHGIKKTFIINDLPTENCDHERLNDYEDACLDCGAVYIDGRWQ